MATQRLYGGAGEQSAKAGGTEEESSGLAGSSPPPLADSRWNANEERAVKPRQGFQKNRVTK